MRLLLVMALAFLAMACDKTIHEVRFNPPANQPLQPPAPMPQEA